MVVITWYLIVCSADIVQTENTWENSCGQHLPTCQLVNMSYWACQTIFMTCGDGNYEFKSCFKHTT